MSKILFILFDALAFLRSKDMPGSGSVAVSEVGKILWF